MWPQYGYTDQHRRVFQPSGDFGPPFRRVWRRTATGAARVPAQHRPRDALPARRRRLADGALRSARARSGWKRKVRQAGRLDPAVEGPNLYVTVLDTGGGAGRALSLRLRNGRIRWSRALPSRTESSPLVDNGRDVLRLRGRDAVLRRRGDGPHDLDVPRRGLGQGQPDARLRAALLRRLRRPGPGRARPRTAGGCGPTAPPGDCCAAAPSTPPPRSRSAASTSGARTGASTRSRRRPAGSRGRTRRATTSTRRPRSRTSRASGRRSTSAPTTRRSTRWTRARGAVRWQHDSGGRISGSPTIVGDVVYFASLGRRKTIGLAVRSGQARVRADGGRLRSRRLRRHLPLPHRLQDDQRAGAAAGRRPATHRRAGARRRPSAPPPKRAPPAARRRPEARRRRAPRRSAPPPAAAPRTSADRRPAPPARRPFRRRPPSPGRPR